MANKILIVSNLRSFLLTIKNILEKSGYKTLIANDGIEALKLAFIENPNLIISELNLPLLNGHHLCRLVKNNTAIHKIPFIILVDSDYDIKKLLNMQICHDECFTKDIIGELESPQLIHTVQNLINQKDKLPQISKINTPKTPPDILSVTNELLDFKLHEHTILNRISLLSKSVYRYEDTIISILESFGEVIDCESIAIFIKRMDTAFMAIYLFRPIDTKFINEIKKNIFSFIQKEGIEYDHEYFKVKTFHDKNFKKELSPCLNLESYLASPIVSHDNIIGVIALCSKDKHAFSKKIEDTFKNIVNTANVVIDNTIMYEQMRNLVISDGLTRLYNHRYFQEKLEEEFSRSKRYNSTFSLAMIDIDDFKHVNNVYGYQIGDIVLKELSHLIYNNYRIMDISARFGGEEFSVILPETNIEGAKLSAERLRKNIQKHAIKGLDKKITISIGLSEYSSALKDRSELLNQAETALLKAKELGKNKVLSWKEIG
ncbi:MAG: diguanylate cyclase [bacterium]|nr:diguanylate cyclase [bacterium]